MGRFPKAFRNAGEVSGRRLRHRLGVSMPVTDKHKTSPLPLIDLGLLEFSVGAVAQPRAPVASSRTGGFRDVDLISGNAREKAGRLLRNPKL